MAAVPIPSGSNSIRKKIRKSWQLYLIFLLPLLYYLIFCYLPMYGIVISLLDYNVVAGIMGSKWIGLHNYVKIVNDPLFWNAAKNTVLLSVYDLLWSFPMPIVFAIMLNELRHSRLKNTIQSISFFPNFISTVVICGIVTNFLATNGIINQMMAWLTHGWVPKQFLTVPEYFRTIYISSGVWKNTGWESIVYIAALTAIDPELYEAARIDGAGRFKQMRYITLPSIMPTMTIMFILAVGRIMNVNFEKVLLLYSNPTRRIADVIQTYVYRLGLKGSDFSYATAAGVFQSVVGFALIYATNRMVKRFGGTSLW